MATTSKPVALEAFGFEVRPRPLFGAELDVCPCGFSAPAASLRPLPTCIAENAARCCPLCHFEVRDELAHARAFEVDA